MAKAPAHKFGQIIGDVLEAAIEFQLQRFAEEHGLYLDKRGPRPARRGVKVTWTDAYENAHDLDFVLERDGSPDQVGTPAAFIETAYRRYTKHSRNKAQEIQGAVLPLAETYRNAAPFIAAILAGIFTEGAISQLKSLGFTILYFPYEAITEAFRSVGIDAYFDEGTPDSELTKKVAAWEALSEPQRGLVANTLIEINSGEVQIFTTALEDAITRRIVAVRILPLHGTASEWASVEEAIAFVQDYDEADNLQPVQKYEIEVRYNNGDRVTGEFAEKGSAIRFLRTYTPQQTAY